MRFEQRNVLVTGGASGIAEQFLAEGARVLVADRDRDDLGRLPARLGDPDRLLTTETDLADPDARDPRDAPRRLRRLGAGVPGLQVAVKLDLKGRDSR
jgi:NAD(P)-dependent dehydrogenase (short-subunit alcohol dehydrogenase family)